MAAENERPVAVVTGAASGIGLALSGALVERGYDCVATDVDRVGLERLSQAVDPARLLTAVVDVSDAAQIERLAEQAFRWRGRVDLLINNAGVLSTGRCWEVPAAEWDRVLGINLHSVLHALRSFVPRLVAQGEGHVLNIGSMASLTAGEQVAVYTVSKHGVLALSECLARDLQGIGSPVRVSVVFPGPVRSAIADRLLDKPTDQVSPLDRHLQGLLVQGMPAEEMARLTLDALERGEFAIFPHATVRDAARHRLAALLEGELSGP